MQKPNRTLLYRSRNTLPQTALNRKSRLSNVKNAFEINNPEKIKNKNILLVDDVYTSGSTIIECSKVLLKNGANHIDVLTLARAA